MDEAHATGVHGDRGGGVVDALGLRDHPSVLCTMHTYGKALGAHGAAIVGPAPLKEYLLNYARPLVYSTALPFAALDAIGCGYDAAAAPPAADARRRLRALARRFGARLAEAGAAAALVRPPPGDAAARDAAAASPIQAVLVPGAARAVAAAAAVQKAGFDVRAVRAPTVPAGAERLRVVLHAHNDEAEVDGLVEAVVGALQRVGM